MGNKIPKDLLSSPGKSDLIHHSCGKRLRDSTSLHLIFRIVRALFFISPIFGVNVIFLMTLRLAAENYIISPGASFCSFPFRF